MNTMDGKTANHFSVFKRNPREQRADPSTR